MVEEFDDWHWADLGNFAWVPQSSLEASENGKNAHTLGRLLRANGFQLRWNMRAGCAEIRQRELDGTEDKWRPWAAFSDRNAAWVRDGIVRHYEYVTDAKKHAKLHYGVDAWADAVGALCALNEVDPFIEWVEQLPYWDGESRIDTLLCDLFGAEDLPIVRWASRFLTLGAVQRSYEPGCKLDEMPVLFAEQGVGKSALLYELLPTGEHPEWFNDQLEFDSRSKERAESLLGRVIVEAAELAGVTRADMQSIKGFVTRRDDSVRLAYGRYVEQLPRRCVIVGSVDRSDCLPNDPAGLRRWVVVTLHSGCHVEKVIPPIREQLWAEALDRYQKGERANLPRDLIPTAAAVAEEHRTRDTVIEDAIADTDLSNADGYTLANIAENIGLIDHGSGAKLSAGQQKQLGIALRNADWERRRVRRDGKPLAIWYPPITQTLPGTPNFGEGASDGF